MMSLGWQDAKNALLSSRQNSFPFAILNNTVKRFEQEEENVYVKRSKRQKSGKMFLCYALDIRLQTFFVRLLLVLKG